MPNICNFVECDESIRSDHYLCRAHWEQEQDDEIDECDNCGQYKLSQYEFCLTCKQELSRSKKNSSRTKTKSKVAESRPEYVAGGPDPRPRRDDDTDVFYVYLLSLNDGKFYAGQTNNLKARLVEHNRGKTRSTSDKNPKLVWFSRARTRSDATAYEQELRKLCRNQNDRAVSTMVAEFLELIGLVYDLRKPAN